MLVRALCGDKAVADIWSTYNVLKAEGLTKESMHYDSSKDLCRCLHFVDDWEEDDMQWKDVYLHTKEEPAEDGRQ